MRLCFPRARLFFDKLVEADAIYQGQAKGHSLVLYAANFGSMAQGGFIGNLDAATVKVRPGTVDRASSVQLSLGDHRMIDDNEPPMVDLHYVNFSNYHTLTLETPATKLADGVQIHQSEQAKPIVYITRQGKIIKDYKLRVGRPVPVEPTLETIFDDVVIRSATALRQSPGILRVNLADLNAGTKGYIRIPLQIGVVGPTGSLYEAINIGHRQDEVSHGALETL